MNLPSHFWPSPPCPLPVQLTVLHLDFPCKTETESNWYYTEQVNIYKHVNILFFK